MGFDGAENSGVKAVWSNPCIETWLNAKIPNCQDSVYCCNIFSNEYKKRYLQSKHTGNMSIDKNLMRNLHLKLQCQLSHMA